MIFLGTVGHRAGVLVPTGDRAGEAVTLRGAGDINLVARGEDVNLHLVANVVRGAILKAQLAQLAAGSDVRLGEVAP